MATTKNKLPHFRVSPKVLGPLGAEQLQDPALAVLELIKNSWDADAKRVAIIVEEQKQEGKGHKIVVTDNGHGMSRTDFETRWLVIGASYKRSVETSEKGRPLIGEKGLGRLATFALGKIVHIESARDRESGFEAKIDWEELQNAPSLEDYGISLRDKRRFRGTRVEIHDLRGLWTDKHTQFLVTHAEFLTAVPGERFKLSLSVNGERQLLQDPVSVVAGFSEAELEMIVEADGTPRITKCSVNGVSKIGVLFRQISPEQKISRLAGLRLNLKFFRRDEAAKRLSEVLDRNVIKDILERYQGIRIYRDGINVPPYGLNGDDWAGLEKQRTSTGGPTMVPGNSQLIGELYIQRRQHPQLVITAGRSGFSNQSTVVELAQYVRWAVREMGTARRAEHFGIDSGEVPTRSDERNVDQQENPVVTARAALEKVARSKAIQKDPTLKRAFEEATQTVFYTLDKNEETLRLYAQLASTGIAATSFAHELRAEFDVISEALKELSHSSRKPDKELLSLLNESWSRIRSFASLFKVIPVKLRRQRKALVAADIKRSIEYVLGLAPPDKVKTKIDISLSDASVKVVPAEFDSILLNLVSNAVKAISESSSRELGAILVSVGSRNSDLIMQVADNGCGVSDKVAAVMFEPLEGHFSEGTGMGLPIVRFIAERYKGNVFVSPHPPKGYITAMSVTLRNIVGT